MLLTSKFNAEERFLQATGQLLSIKKKEHEHKHRTIPWDESRFGPQVVDKTQTHATQKFLHMCHCGDKVEEKVRTLIT